MLLSLDGLQRLISVSLHSNDFTTSGNCSNGNGSCSNGNVSGNVGVMAGTYSPAAENPTQAMVSVTSDLTNNDGETIPVIISHRTSRNGTRGRNFANLVRVNDTKKCLSYGTTVLNARSLFPKINFIPQLFDQLNVAVLSVSETWSHNPPTETEKQIIHQLKTVYGINYIGAPRTNTRRRRGGGVAILHLDKFFEGQEIPLVPAPPRNCEIVAALLKPIIPGPLKGHVFLSLYCVPDLSRSDQCKMMDYLRELYKRLSRSYPPGQFEFSVSGDFNRVDPKQIGNCFGTLTNLSMVPTRKKSHLDHFLTSHPENYCLGQTAPPLGYGSKTTSDHLMVVVRTRNLWERRDHKQTVRTRATPLSAMSEFSEFLLGTNWLQLRLFDANQTAEHLDQCLGLACDQIFPEKLSKLNTNNNQPWFTEKLANLKGRRAREYLSKGKSDLYHELDNQYNQGLKEAKIKFREEKITQALISKNPKEMFRNIRLLAGVKTKESCFILPGDEGKPAKEIANKLCVYFSKISQEYPAINVEKMPMRVKNFLAGTPHPPQISQQEVLEIMQRMKKSTSSVEGDIPPKVKNQFIEQLSIPITELANNCLRECTFPKKYRIETCVVLPKVNPPQSLDQLRNLGLTQFNSKVLEGVIIHFLEPYLQEDDGQFGGKKKHSCTHYIIELISFILESWEEPDSAVVAALADFSKGFNRVDHNRLIVTLCDMGVPLYLILIIISYLSGRVMRVRYRGEYSDEKDLPGGAPQGGLLSIIIFCVYTVGNGMKLSDLLRNTSPEEYPCLPMNQPMRQGNTMRLKYVDDTTLAAKVALTELLKLKGEEIIPPWLFEEKGKRELTPWEMSENKNELHDMIEDMEHFVRLSKMKLNTDKTKTMFFNHRQKDGIAKYYCEGTELEQVETYKVLGFQLQSNLRITEHIKTMLTKVACKVWALRTVMENNGGTAVGKQFYITWISCHLENMAPVWHSRLTQKQSDSIEKVQQKCFRIILRKGYVDYQQACKTLEMVTQVERREELCFKFVQNAMKHHPHLYPRDENARSTRQGGRYHMAIPKFSLNLHRKSGKVALGLLYNAKLDKILKQQDRFGKQCLPPATKNTRCKKCPGCIKQNCGLCSHCQDMRQFGGPGKIKQACVQRTCQKLLG